MTENRLRMPWIIKHERAFRVAELALLLAAILGPWGFDRINVPAQYPCNAPNFRLEGDFCGTPLSGAFVLLLIISEVGYLVSRLVTGIPLNPNQALALSILILILLPLFSTIVLVLRGGKRGTPVFHMVALVLAVCAGLFVSLFFYPRLFWVLWGPWSYIGVAAGALVLEAAMLMTRRRRVAGG